MTQPEALRLAELLEQIDGQYWQVQDSAAAELRRLHAENQELREEVAELRAWFEVEGGQLKRAITAERERCEKVCDAINYLVGAIETVGIPNAGARKVLRRECEAALKCAAVIRARGEKA